MCFINVIGGIISTSPDVNLDYFISSSYDITVMVTDGLNMSHPANVTVDLTMVNRPPFFRPDTYKANIVEKSRNVRLVGKLE